MEKAKNFVSNFHFKPNKLKLVLSFRFSQLQKKLLVVGVEANFLNGYPKTVEVLKNFFHGSTFTLKQNSRGFDHYVRGLRRPTCYLFNALRTCGGTNWNLGKRVLCKLLPHCVNNRTKPLKFLSTNLEAAIHFSFCLAFSPFFSSGFIFYLSSAQKF